MTLHLCDAVTSSCQVWLITGSSKSTIGYLMDALFWLSQVLYALEEFQLACCISKS